MRMTTTLDRERQGMIPSTNFSMRLLRSRHEWNQNPRVFGVSSPFDPMASLSAYGHGSRLHNGRWGSSDMQSSDCNQRPVLEPHHQTSCSQISGTNFESITSTPLAEVNPVSRCPPPGLDFQCFLFAPSNTFTSIHVFQLEATPLSASTPSRNESGLPTYLMTLILNQKHSYFGGRVRDERTAEIRRNCQFFRPTTTATMILYRYALQLYQPRLHLASPFRQVTLILIKCKLCHHNAQLATSTITRKIIPINVPVQLAPTHSPVSALLHLWKQSISQRDYCTSALFSAVLLSIFNVRLSTKSYGGCSETTGTNQFARKKLEKWRFHLHG